MSEQTATIFTDIQANESPTVIQSVCTKCFESGETTILLTKIPFFREIMITSFYCDKCGNKNNEVQFAGELPDYGVKILFRIMNSDDLNRQVIKSENAKIYFEQLDLQVPQSKKAQITTIQGLLMRINEEISMNQQERKQNNPEQYANIEKFLNKLKIYMKGEKFPLTMTITDPSGNSNIKNPYAPKQDKNLQVTNIARTLEDLTNMGYSLENAKQEVKLIEEKSVGNKINFTKPFQESEFMKYEPVLFEVPCHSCQMPGHMKMCEISVPYFTDLIIMSFVCDYCGAHSTETKNSGEVKEEGCCITLKSSDADDLKRDLFKSETCSVLLPELDLQLDYGTLGGVFTTVEGLLEKIHDHLNERNSFTDSDSQFHVRMTSLLNDLKAMRKGKKPFTMILKDPLAHSFLQNPNHPDEDLHATRVFAVRTQDQNEILGLNDIKVENYQLSPSKMKKQNHKVLETQQAEQSKEHGPSEQEHENT